MPSDDREPEGDKLNAKHAEFLYQVADMFKNCYVIDLRKYMPKHDEEFKKNLLNRKEFDVQIFEIIGDGIALIKKKNEKD